MTKQTVPKPLDLLAIDLGTVTGWYVNESLSGIWKLNSASANRLINLSIYLDFTIISTKIKSIAYEKVRRHIGTQAAHVYGALEGILLIAAYRHNLKVIEVEISEAKFALTGNSKASKEQMIQAFFSRHNRAAASSDEADSYGVWLAAAKRLQQPK